MRKRQMKKHQMKKHGVLSAALLALCMAFALAGCGGSGDGADNGLQGGTEGTDIVFETTDLNGDPVDSGTVFAGNKVTMVNIWGTYCGPCINEMPELETLNQEFSGKGGAIIGLVCDVPLGDDTKLADAHSIVRDTGVTYPSLKAWDGFDSVMPLTAIPTTYFVDSQGKLMGEPIVGADPQAYRERMEEYLQ